jgi:hypothetical protein
MKKRPTTYKYRELQHLNLTACCVISFTIEVL